jgi:hypothetical protein
MGVEVTVVDGKKQAVMKLTMGGVERPGIPTVEEI